MPIKRTLRENTRRASINDQHEIQYLPHKMQPALSRFAKKTFRRTKKGAVQKEKTWAMNGKRISYTKTTRRKGFLKTTTKNFDSKGRINEKRMVTIKTGKPPKTKIKNYKIRKLIRKHMNKLFRRK